MIQPINKEKILIYILLFVAFVLPILGLKNCPNWNEGNGLSGACHIDSPLLREYADFYYGLILLTVFTGFPAIIYFGAVLLLVKLIRKLFKNKAT